MITQVNGLSTCMTLWHMLDLLFMNRHGIFVTNNSTQINALSTFMTAWHAFVPICLHVEVIPRHKQIVHRSVFYMYGTRVLLLCIICIRTF